MAAHRSRRVFLFLVVAALWYGAHLSGADCNRNGIDDSLDLAPGSIRFEPPENTAIGGPPGSIASADLDGDDDLDLATANGAAATVSILINDGDGAFATGVDLVAGAHMASVVAADLDGDHDLDLAAADLASSSVSLLRNDGEARFAAAGQTATGQGPSFITAGDLDLDGNVDLLTTSAGTFGVPGNRFSILMGAGGGLFDSPFHHFVSLGPTSAVIADIDRDGLPDVAVTSRGACCPFPAGSLTVCWNVGGGNLIVGGTFPVGLEPVAVSAADLDGDLDLDLATANRSSGTASVLVNDGGRQFAPASEYAVDELPAALAAVDIDGDLDRDLVTANTGYFGSDVVTPGITVLRNDGDADFERQLSDLPYADGTQAMAAGDLDGDGDSDLALAGLTASVSVHLNLGDGTFSSSQERFRAGAAPHAAAAADFDGDGDLDLATGCGGLLRNGGGGAFAAASPCTGAGTIATAADLDGDGYPDLVTAEAILINLGNGSFAAPVPHGAAPLAAIAAELDGDGDVDLVFLEAGTCCPPQEGSVRILLNQGDGTFAAGGTRGAGLFPRALAAADMDGDGRLDLIVGNSLENGNGNILHLGNMGAAVFEPVANYPTGDGPNSIAARDLDGDHDPDLAVAGYASVVVHRNQGGGALDGGTRYEAGINPWSLVAGDLDGDADTDLAVLTIDGFCCTDLTVLANAGDGSFGEPTNFEVPRFADSLVAGELDGILAADIATANGFVYSVSVLRNLTAPPFSRDGNANGIPDECESRTFHRGDPTGEGTTNISDGISLLNFLFLGGVAPACTESADADNDGQLLLTDAVYLFNFLFLGGGEPAPPGPVSDPCGPDPDAPGSSRDLGCESYEGCG